MNIRKSSAKSMELLAPAGSFAAFEAAVSEGADAVYFGAPVLNARAPARDFTLAEIGAMVRYAHQAGVKAYIAMNSLVKEAELPLAIESIAHFEANAVDALIVQDIGLLHLVRTNFPNLRLHASTLMSVHNSIGVDMLLDLGCRRIVLPRELTIDEIGTLFRRTGAELEVFVHGAMCFSYSGLCLFSSLHGGKSSLRGHCVQPCRRSYAWLRKKGGKGGRPAAGKGGGHLFSMNDLSAIDLLPELARAGVASLKIEGRLKSAEYVRKTVRAYRLMLDSLEHPEQAAAEGRGRQAEARQLLDEAMGRRRSTGFLLARRPPETITPHLSGNIGLMVGKVHRMELQGAPGRVAAAVLTVSLRHPVREGDRLRLHDEKTGGRTSFTLRSLWAGGRKIQQGNAGQTVRMEANAEFSGKPGKNFHGSLFKVDIGTGRQDEKKAREKVLGRAGKNIEPDRDRIRTAMHDIASAALQSAAEVPPGSEMLPPERRQSKKTVRWWIKVNVFRDMHFRLPMAPEKYILPVTGENVAHAENYSGKYAGRIIWSLPPVILEDRLEWYSEAAAFLIRNKYTRFMIGHFSQVRLLQAIGGVDGRLDIFGDYTVNVLNSQALGTLNRNGLAGTLFSVETDRENLAEALRFFHRHPREFSVGMYVYGRPALFTARLDDPQYEYGKRFVSPRGEEYILSRADDLTLARSVLPFSLLDEWKNLVRTGVDFLLVDLRTGTMKRNVSEIIALYTARSDSPPSMSGNYSVGLT